MKRLGLVLTALTLMVGASTAFAQRPGGGFGGGGAGALLAVAEVQKELNITDAQKEKLQKELASAREGLQGLRDLSAEERQKRLAELTKKTDETIKSVLDAKQQERLGELRIQSEGASALARAEVAEKVGLGPDQKEKVKKITEEAAAAGRVENFQNLTQEERTKLATAARERREKNNAVLLALLSPEQKGKFEKLQGAKFTFPERRPRGNN